MTYEQIEKGLECCARPEDYGCGKCTDCPYNDGYGECCYRLGIDALAYINRLKAESADKERAYNDKFNLRKDLVRELKAEKAVSDRALELAVDNYDNSSEVKQAFIDEAKQELEKERKDET